MRGTSALNSQKRWRKKRERTRKTVFFSLEKREKGEKSPKDTQEIATGGERDTAPLTVHERGVCGEKERKRSAHCLSFSPSQTRAKRGGERNRREKGASLIFPPPPPSRAISPSPLPPHFLIVYIYVVCVCIA